MERAQHGDLLKKAKRIVIKVGSSTLTHENGKLNLHRIELLVRQLTDLRYAGKEVVLVSSGAIAAGMGKLNIPHRPKTIPEQQALAAVGQGVLLHLYEKMFAEYGQTTAQLLLTKADMDNHQRFLNARNTLQMLLQLGVIPVVNENDTVSVDEIRFGDNDTLAAMVGALIDSDLVILLTDIDGLYDANPKENPSAKRMAMVEKIDTTIENLAKGAGSKFGTGGMVTKIMAAKIAVNGGIPLVIADGSDEGIIRKICAGEEIGTLFLPLELKPHLRKSWITFGRSVAGKIIVDDGAKRALAENGKSLLPSGIKAVEGVFQKGAVVSVADLTGKEFARGIVNYTDKEIAQIMGAKTAQIAEILGYNDYDEVIHRDNLGLLI